MEWLQTPIFVFDTETTGLDPVRDRIIQLAILRFEAGKKWSDMQAWTIMGDPGIPIPPDATMVHGFTNAKLIGKPPVEAKAKRILEILSGGQIFLAYNAEFDTQFLHYMMKRAGLKEPLPCNQNNTIDPLTFSRGLDPHVRGHKLGQVAARLGVHMRTQHDALADAQGAAEVMVRLAARNPLPKDLNGLITLQERYRLEWKRK